MKNIKVEKYIELNYRDIEKGLLLMNLKKITNFKRQLNLKKCYNQER